MIKITETFIDRPKTLDAVTDYAADNFRTFALGFNKLSLNQNNVEKDAKILTSEITKHVKTIKKLERCLTIISVLGMAYVFINEKRMEEIRNIKMQDEKNVLQMDNIEEQLYSVSDRVTVLELFNNKNGEKLNNKEG